MVAEVTWDEYVSGYPFRIVNSCTTDKNLFLKSYRFCSWEKSFITEQFTKPSENGEEERPEECSE